MVIGMREDAGRRIVTGHDANNKSGTMSSAWKTASDYIICFRTPRVVKGQLTLLTESEVRDGMDGWKVMF